MLLLRTTSCRGIFQRSATEGGGGGGLHGDPPPPLEIGRGVPDHPPWSCRKEILLDAPFRKQTFFHPLEWNDVAT